MSQRNYTREELANEPYLKKSQIKKLFNLSTGDTNKVFEKASELDDRELFRAETKVRTKSVCKVIGYEVDEIKKLVRKERT